MKYIGYLFKYLDAESVKNLSDTSKKSTILSRRVRYIPGIYKKYIYIKYVDDLINRFPRIIHCNIWRYSEKINDYIHLFRQKLMKLNFSNVLKDVSCCEDVTDVSALGNVHTLNLSCCENVTDVSALGNVHTLDLSCTEVSDVSALGNVHTLNLSWCKNVSDVSALGNVHTLDLSFCVNITNLSDLKNVHTLYLLNCMNVKDDISILTNVNIIYDISILPNVNIIYD